MVGYSKGVIFGSNANNSANAGFAYADSYYAPSDADADIGSHLCFKSQNNGLATWQKITS